MHPSLRTKPPAAPRPAAARRKPPQPALATSRKERSDGAEARAQLIRAAIKLFSDKGFAKTSTREIALAAGANIAAISYYFGDKAGLYRAVFTEPLGVVGDRDITAYNQPGQSLRDSLRVFLCSFLEPMKQGELVQLSARLHFREMLEPTGLWAQEVDEGIKPAHAAMVAMLSRHLGLAEADDGVHRLAFCIGGLVVQLFVCRDVVESVRPQLFDQPESVDEWGAQMIDYAEAMVLAEKQRRARPVQAAPRTAGQAPAPARQKAKP
ncbi:MAG: CerR family C-terminal domain-containing protein [Polaromonas sp.]|nr:CerR family C-terminal domain-containing protein [Polaromonas sp.]